MGAVDRKNVDDIIEQSKKNDNHIVETITALVQSPLLKK